jgi:hypothetical protein
MTNPPFSPNQACVRGLTACRRTARAGQLQGPGVEQLNSMEAEHFTSGEELLAFLRRILSAQQLAEVVSI